MLALVFSFLSCCVILTTFFLFPIRRVIIQPTVGQVSLAQLEERWATLANADRQAVKSSLSTLMKGDWKSLTAEQKRAGTSSWI